MMLKNLWLRFLSLGGWGLWSLLLVIQLIALWLGLRHDTESVSLEIERRADRMLTELC